MELPDPADLRQAELPGNRIDVSVFVDYLRQFSTSVSREINKRLPDTSPRDKSLLISSSGLVFSVSVDDTGECYLTPLKVNSVSDPSSAVRFLTSGSTVTSGRPGASKVNILSRLQFVPDLRDWNGVDYTGSHDSASVVQKAFDASASEGFELQVPAFLCDAGQGIILDSTITCPGAPRVKGAGRFQQEAINGANPGLSGSTGTVFKITHAGIGFDVSNRAGAQFRDFTTRRIQPEPTTTSFTPNNNDWDFKLSGVDHQLQRIHLMNATKGIVSWNGGRHILEDITGNPLQQGYLCRASGDALKINRMHFWAFWRDGAYPANWLLSNFIPFHFQRCDNGFVDDLFSIWAAQGFQVDDLSGLTGPDAAWNGPTNKLKVGKLDMDLCRNAILINSVIGCTVDFGLISTQGYVNEINDYYTPSPSIPRPTTVNQHSLITGNNSIVHFDSYSHRNAWLSGLFVGGTNNQVTVGHGAGGMWSVATGTSPGFAVDTSNGSSLLITTPINSGAPASGGPLLGTGVKKATFT